MAFFVFDETAASFSTAKNLLVYNRYEKGSHCVFARRYINYCAIEDIRSCATNQIARKALFTSRVYANQHSSTTVHL